MKLRIKVKMVPLHNSVIRFTNPITAKRTKIPTGAISKMIIFIADVMKENEEAAANRLFRSILKKNETIIKNIGVVDIRYL
jgi:hypothetical protein